MSIRPLLLAVVFCAAAIPLAAASGKPACRIVLNTIDPGTARFATLVLTIPGALPRIERFAWQGYRHEFALAALPAGTLGVRLELTDADGRLLAGAVTNFRIMAMTNQHVALIVPGGPVNWVTATLVFPDGGARNLKAFAIPGSARIMLEWDEINRTDENWIYWTDDGSLPSKTNGQRRHVGSCLIDRTTRRVSTILDGFRPGIRYRFAVTRGSVFWEGDASPPVEVTCDTVESGK